MQLVKPSLHSKMEWHWTLIQQIYAYSKVSVISLIIKCIIN